MYVVAPHQNCLTEMNLMRGHNICFIEKIEKIILDKKSLSGAITTELDLILIYG